MQTRQLSDLLDNVDEIVMAEIRKLENNDQLGTVGVEVARLLLNAIEELDIRNREWISKSWLEGFLNVRAMNERGSVYEWDYDSDEREREILEGIWPWGTPKKRSYAEMLSGKWEAKGSNNDENNEDECYEGDADDDGDEDDEEEERERKRARLNCELCG